MTALTLPATIGLLGTQRKSCSKHTSPEKGRARRAMTPKTDKECLVLGKRTNYELSVTKQSKLERKKRAPASLY
jgi:hypothetical protein